MPSLPKIWSLPRDLRQSGKRNLGKNRVSWASADDGPGLYQMDFTATATFQDNTLHVHGSSVASSCPAQLADFFFQLLCGKSTRQAGCFNNKPLAFLNAHSHLGYITRDLQKIFLVSTQTLLKAMHRAGGQIPSNTTYFPTTSPWETCQCKPFTKTTGLDVKWNVWSSLE